jgi:hypothetical protein
VSTKRTNDFGIIDVYSLVIYNLLKFRWFGQKKGMSDEKITKIVYKAERMGDGRQDRDRIGWIEGKENILKEGVRSTSCRRTCMRASMRVEEAKEICRD